MLENSIEIIVEEGSKNAHRIVAYFVPQPVTKLYYLRFLEPCEGFLVSTPPP
jgi:hypothetical protein